MQKVRTLPSSSTVTWLCAHVTCGISPSMMERDRRPIAGMSASPTTNARSMKYLGTLDPSPRSARCYAGGHEPTIPLVARTVYVAPPDRHLLLNQDGTMSLSQSELVHFVRPSADLLFESTAASFRGRAIAVVLTGTGVDGSMGVRAIKKMGGTVIAQDAQSSEYFGMPSAAIDTGDVDFVLSLKEISPALVALVTGDEL